MLAKIARIELWKTGSKIIP